jgi:hypothetical protein
MSQSKDWAQYDFDCRVDRRLDEHEHDAESLAELRLDYVLRGCSSQHSFLRSGGGLINLAWVKVRDDLLRLYNWYYHYCRVEAEGEVVCDGRPEEDRLWFHAQLEEYFEGDVPWPGHIDKYYFELGRRTWAEDVDEAAAAQPASLPYVWTPRNPIDVARSHRAGFEHLDDCSYDDYKGDDRTKLLAAGGLADYIIWDNLILTDEEVARKCGGDQRLMENYFVRRWCAIYKCCQVRVDDGSLEDGRTPYYRNLLDTDHMMGYFSTDSRYHQNGEELDDGYTRIPTGLPRIQILQHRRWLARRAEEGQPVGLEVEFDDVDNRLEVEFDDVDHNSDDDSLFSDMST